MQCHGLLLQRDYSVWVQPTSTPLGAVGSRSWLFWRRDACDLTRLLLFFTVAYICHRLSTPSVSFFGCNMYMQLLSSIQYFTLSPTRTTSTYLLRFIIFACMACPAAATAAGSSSNSILVPAAALTAMAAAGAFVCRTSHTTALAAADVDDAPRSGAARPSAGDEHVRASATAAVASSSAAAADGCPTSANAAPEAAGAAAGGGALPASSAAACGDPAVAAADAKPEDKAAAAAQRKRWQSGATKRQAMHKRKEAAAAAHATHAQRAPLPQQLDFDTLETAGLWERNAAGERTCVIPRSRVQEFVHGEEERLNGCAYFNLCTKNQGGKGTLAKGKLSEITYACHCGPNDEHSDAARAASQQRHDAKISSSSRKSRNAEGKSRFSVTVFANDPSSAEIRYIQPEHAGHDPFTDQDAHLPESVKCFVKRLLMLNPDMSTADIKKAWRNDMFSAAQPLHPEMGREQLRDLVRELCASTRRFHLTDDDIDNIRQAFYRTRHSLHKNEAESVRRMDSPIATTSAIVRLCQNRDSQRSPLMRQDKPTKKRGGHHVLVAADQTLSSQRSLQPRRPKRHSR